MSRVTNASAAGPRAPSKKTLNALSSCKIIELLLIDFVSNDLARFVPVFHVYAMCSMVAGLVGRPHGHQAVPEHNDYTQQ